jgi:peptide/nickel transport system substrate-binding protein
MFTKIKSDHILPLLIIPMLILAACQTAATPETVVETLVITQVVEATPVEVIQVVTPTPEPAGPRTLVICTDEPEGFNAYGSSGAIAGTIIEAIFEGGSLWAIDANSFAYQPIILEKLPNLADGDAALSVVTVSEGDIVVDANSGVVTLDDAADPPIMLIPAGGGDPIPYQGGDFEMDKLSATFKLLPGLLWSDGAPLTAADSVFTFNLVADPNNPADKYDIERTASYEAIDDLTIVWTGLPGYLNDIYYILFYGPAPEHLWGNYTTAELFISEEYSRAPIGWGPYMFGEWVAGESITLHKNPNYFRADEGLPKFDSVVFRFTGGGSNVEIAALLSGECDVITSDLSDQIELLLELQESDQLKASFTTVTSWEHIDFGIQPREYDDGYQLGVDRPDFFSDVRTRRAFAMCMDRQALVGTILFDQSLVPDSYLPPQHPLYNPDVRHYDFDVSAGSALLEQVGWLDDDDDPGTPRIAQGVPNIPDGTPLEVAFETTSNPLRQQVTAIIKDSLAQCGIKANIQLYAPSEWFANAPEGKLFGRHFDLGEFAWNTGPVANCGFWLSSLTPGPIGETWVSIQDGVESTFNSDWDGLNVNGFVDSNFDTACGATYITLPGQPEYEAAHLEAQRIFTEQLPVVPLFSHIIVAAARPDMCGFIMDPTANSELWNIEEFDYGEGCEE